LHCAFWFTLSACGFLSDTTLICNDIFWDLIAAQVGWAHSSNVDCNIMSCSLSCVTGGVYCYQYANLSWQVRGGFVEVWVHIGTFKTCDTANFNLFAQQCAFFFDEVAQWVAVIVSCQEGFEVVSTRSCSNFQNSVTQFNKFIGFCNEVSFGVDLDHDTNAIFDGCGDKTFSSRAAFTFGSSLESFDTNDL